MSSKCDLQNTQTAPLAAVCTPTIKLVQQNHQKLEISKNVCVRKTCTLLFLYLFPPLPTLTLILPFISLSLLLGITEFCYAFMTCVRTLSCFSEKAYLQNQQWGAWGSAHVCAWLRLSVPLAVRSALLSGPHPSQMMTRGGLQLTSNHTRITYWKGSSASLCLPKLRPCGVT